MAARAGNGLDDIRQQAEGLVKASGMVRLQVVNKNGQLVLDAGEKSGRDRAEAEAASLADIVLRLRPPAVDYLQEEFEVIDLLSQGWRLRIWDETPFVLAAWFPRNKAQAADKFGREQLKDLVNALQEELT
ncbi:hypothetical protein KQI63_13925 [bacterium]|nr:hypothetical protein [bacterium]